MYTPKTRAEKRKAIREASKIEAIFKPIEQSFIIEVFSANKSYNDSYVSHLNAFKEQCDWIHNSSRFPWFKVNEKYFVNQYKPEV